MVVKFRDWQVSQLREILHETISTPFTFIYGVKNTGKPDPAR